MKINLQTCLASHSAAAKSPAKLISFLQEVFKLKAPAAKTMADTLVNLSKEKALVTPAIDAFLEFAKTAKQPDIEKAIKSKTVQNLKPVLVSIVKNKTFAGTIAAVKKFKFKAPVSKPATAKAPVSKPATAKAPVSKPATAKAPLARSASKEKVLSSYANFTQYLVDNEEDSNYAKDFNLLLGIKTKEAGIADNGDEEGIYAKHMKTRATIYLLDPRSSPDVIKLLGKKVKPNYCLVYTDTFENEGPFNGMPSPVPGTAIVLPFKEALVEFVRQVTLPAPIQKPRKSN
ncbi:MAG: hypothetical protein ACRC6V_03190 [Bacteroidales bacterium]